MTTIGAVSRKTGIATATHRTWESRCGCRAPQRSPGGQCVFFPSDVDRVLAIVRRIANGQRAGEAVFGVEQSILQAEQSSLVSDPFPCAVDRMQASDLLAQGRFIEFERVLENRLGAQGTQTFAQILVMPLMDAVGVLWQSGLLPVYADPIFSSVLQTVVTRSVSLIDSHQVHSPQVLIVFPAGEMHSSTLVLLITMLYANSIPAVFFQGGLAASEIARAAELHGVQVLALSASVIYPLKLLKSELHNLRAMQPRTVEIRLGGAGTYRIEEPMHGIVTMTSMEVCVQCLRTKSQLSARRARIAHCQCAAPITLQGIGIDFKKRRPAKVACHSVAHQIHERHGPGRSGGLISLCSRFNQ